jgi:hypothetical protein
MFTRRKSVRYQQQHLFRPRPATPRWENLSAETRHKALTLLAKMLRTSVDAHLTAPRGTEANDE